MLHITSLFGDIHNWKECEEQVKGFPCNVYKSYKSKDEEKMVFDKNDFVEADCSYSSEMKSEGRNFMLSLKEKKEGFFIVGNNVLSKFLVSVEVLISLTTHLMQ